MAAVRTRRPLRAALAAVVAVATLALAACSGQAQGYAADGEKAGYVSGDKSVTTWDPGHRPGPIELTGTSFAGDPIDVASWRGDVVLVNTWYANCPPCRAEAPDLAAVVTEYGPQGLKAVGINTRDEAGTAQAFVRTYGLTYPSIQDTDGSAIASLQGTVPLRAVPTTVLLDRQGRVAARILGMADPSTLRTLVADLLGESG
ncbi:TlpA disulfide reductase family protein [Isoptericola sp. b441]|uniref:TlpA disulfide reductase family protein n=1 Tax=Actinotalea lenta TaxID=3064654 RepID=A0ABT9D6M9_9CELL|nr:MULTISPECIES: TlpA disulfide reductase family protein [unclassified Isoptericola]MDO8106492.1 TlpA disulfide reductase family protein [Isoptericola sp. b441]MDO8121792.1 TlpA disulfide reductase family protein [Isoptericola sp. b490]